MGRRSAIARLLLRLLLAISCGMVLLGIGVSGGVTVASALSFNSASAGHNTVATSLTLTAPAGSIRGDVMIASVDADGSPTVSPPTGWTLIRTDVNAASTHMSQSLYRHVVGASEPTSYTWQLSAKVGAGGTVVDYRGADASNPVDVSSGQGSVKSAQIVAPSLNVASAGELLVGSFGYSDIGQIGAPAGMTSRVSDMSANPPGQRTTVELADQSLTAAGRTGTRSVGFSQPENSIGQLVALKPDVTPPSAPALLTETGSTGTSITLSWTPSTDNAAVTGYAVYQAGALLTSVATTSYTLTGLSCGSSYNVAVRAYDPSANYSTPVSMTAATAACPIPTRVSLTAPADGSTVTGSSVAFTASTTGSAAIQSVQFQVDGNPVTAPVASSPYTTTWDSTTASNGPHVVTAVATDANGNIVTSSPISITVNNAPAPLPTTVSLTAPSGGAIVSGSNVQMTASTTGSAAIRSVQFQVTATQSTVR